MRRVSKVAQRRAHARVTPDNGTRVTCSGGTERRTREACGFARLRDSHDFHPLERSASAFSKQILASRGVREATDEVVDCERQLRFCRELGVRAGTQVGRARGVRGDGLCAGLFQRAQLGAEGAFELEAAENRSKSFAKLLVVGDRIGDVRAANFLGFFAAEPRQERSTPSDFSGDCTA